MDILYATDQHIKGRNPGSRLDDYPQAGYNKMRELEQECRERIKNGKKPAALVFGGDLFDTPRVAYAIIIRFARILRRIRRMGIPVYLVPGNHDLYGYSMDTLDQTAIGILASTGVITLLTQERSVLLEGDKGLKVEIHGREYDKDLDSDPDTDYNIDIQHNAHWNILFSHGMLLEKAFHPDVRHTLTKDVVSDADLIMNGHYHPGYPVHAENGIIFGNPGSSGRDEICKRQPKYAVINVLKKGIKVKYVEYACAAPYADIFDFSVKQDAKQHERYLEAFEQTVQDAVDFDAYDPRDVLDGLDKAQAIDKDILASTEAAIVAAEQQYHDTKLDGYVEKKLPIAIDEIELTNFESHAHTVVKLSHTGLNAITGVTDSGKSGVIRALRWVLYNEPKGSAFIRLGESRATATIRFSDGSSITRSRTHSDAGTYTISDAAGNVREFKGFGNAIPIDVANIHQMPKVELAPGIERSLNFAYQLDAHFLLSESGGVRAATIGRLTGVHIIDAAIKEKKREILGLTKTVNAAEDRIEDINLRLQGFDDLQELKGQLDLSTVLLRQAEALENEIFELTDDMEAIAEANKAIKTIQKNLDGYADVAKAEKRILIAEKKVAELKELLQLKEELETAELQIEEIKDDLTHYGLLDVANKKLDKAEKMAADIRELKTLHKEYAEAEELEDALQDDVNAYRNIDKAQTLLQGIESTAKEIAELRELQAMIDSADTSIAVLETNIKHQTDLEETARRKIKNVFAGMGNKCPTCQQDMDEEHMEHVVDAM